MEISILILKGLIYGASIQVGQKIMNKLFK